MVQKWTSSPTANNWQIYDREISIISYQVSWYRNGGLLPADKTVVQTRGNRHSLLLQQVDITDWPKAHSARQCHRLTAVILGFASKQKERRWHCLNPACREKGQMSLEKCRQKAHDFNIKGEHSAGWKHWPAREVPVPCEEPAWRGDGTHRGLRKTSSC